LCPEDLYRRAAHILYTPAESPPASTHVSRAIITRAEPTKNRIFAASAYKL
jgi:hypothetical protein